MSRMGTSGDISARIPVLSTVSNPVQELIITGSCRSGQGALAGGVRGGTARVGWHVFRLAKMDDAEDKPAGLCAVALLLPGEALTRRRFDREYG
jgi:hypothetical protein